MTDTPDDDPIRSAFNAAADAEDDDASDDLGDSREHAGDVDPEILALCARERQNDFGNGQRLLRHFGRDLLFVRNAGPHVWCGTHYEMEGGDERALAYAHRTSERIHLEADMLAATPQESEAVAAGAAARAKSRGDRDDAETRLAAAADAAEADLAKRKVARRRFAVSSGNGARAAAMIAQAVPYRSEPPEAMDADPLKLNILNGTLRFIREPDLECPDPDAKRYKARVELRPHDRADLMTRVAPATYDPDAACPKFDGFLQLFQPNPAVRRFLQAFHGYATLGLIGEQVLVFNYGTGANGKSTFYETIARILGPYAQTLNAEAVTGDGQRRGDQATPEFARLPGARLVRVSELPRGAQLKEALVKALTGGEPMLVRHLNKGFFEFRPIFKAALSGNDLPNIGGVDYGIWRRMRLVRWEVQIADADRRPMEEILTEFEAERPGILNWLIEGACIYLAEGLRAPPEVVDATEHYREDMDPVGAFAEACVERVDPAADGSFTSYVAARAMYEAYVSWCMANSVKAFTENAFGRIFPQKGFIRTKDRIRKYINVRLKDVPERPLAPNESGGGP